MNGINVEFSKDQNTLTAAGFVLVAEKASNGCRRCAFLAKGNHFDICGFPSSDQKSYCIDNHRKDSQNIIWVLKE